MWKRGDPYPENWHQWLKEADIEWCDVEIRDGYRVVWNNGNWQGGIWRNGTWVNGVWQGGNWYNGTWNNGVWHDGNWYDGIWMNGIWETGIWETGIWHDGTWVNGSEVRPRFWWRGPLKAMTGIRGGRPSTLPYESWLKLDLCPHQRAALVAYKAWLDAKEIPYDGSGLNFWDEVLDP
jgi:hypothetical protein